MRSGKAPALRFAEPAPRIPWPPSAEQFIVSEQKRAFASLARAIGNVVDDATRTRDRCVRARANLALRFGIDPWLARYEKLYETLAARRIAGAGD